MNKITIQTAGGAEVRTSGNLKVVAGAGASVEVKDGRLVVSRTAPDGWKEAYYRENFNAIYDHRHGEAEVPGVQGLMATFAFAAPPEDDPPGPNSGIPDDEGYWIGRINGVWGFHNHLSVTGGPTFRWEPAWKDGSCNGIRIDDIGRPDLDCGDYLKLAEYVRKLAAAYDGLKTQILGDPASGPGGEELPGRYAEIYGFHKQYEATLMLWNYLVYVSSVVFNASFQQRALFLQGKFINGTDQEIALGDVTLSCRVPSGESEFLMVTGKLFPTIRAESSIAGRDLTWQFSQPAEGGTMEQVFTRTDAATWEFTPGDYDIQPQEEVEFLARIDLSWSEFADVSVEAAMSWNVPTQLPDGIGQALITRRRTVPLHDPTTSLTVDEVSQQVTVGWDDDVPVVGTVHYKQPLSVCNLVLKRTEFGLNVRGYVFNGGDDPVYLVEAHKPVVKVWVDANLDSFTYCYISAAETDTQGFSTLPTPPTWAINPVFRYSLDATSLEWTLYPGLYELPSGHSVSFDLPLKIETEDRTPDSFTLFVLLQWTVNGSLGELKQIVYVK